MYDSDDEGLGPPVLALPFLKKLEVNYAGIRLLSHFKSFPKLNHLKLVDCSSQCASSIIESWKDLNLISLEFVNMFGTSNLESDPLLSFLQSHVNLSTLSFKNCSVPFAAPLREAPWICPHLERINLFRCEVVRPGDLLAFVDARTSPRRATSIIPLQSLHLRETEGVPDDIRAQIHAKLRGV